MPKQQHQPYETKAYNKGANHSIEDEFLGAARDGEYIDAKNMRPNEMDGDYGALEKIKGEEVKFPHIDNTCNQSLGGANFINLPFVCMAATEVRGMIVEFYAPTTIPYIVPSKPFIRVNGIIIAASPGLPIHKDYPIQVATNDNCLGGEIYFTNNRDTPMILNIEDMQLNSGINVGGEIGNCTEKYFSSFDPDDHSINLTFSPNRPVFIATSPTASWSDSFGEAKVFTAGGGGLEVGQYGYSIRYVDSEGNRTQFSPMTPLIPIYDGMSLASPQYPGIKTFGDSPGFITTYGNVIRFRVDNRQNYDYVEIKRISYNGGQGAGFVPQSELIGTIDLEDKETGFKTFLDYGAEVEEIITDEEDTARFTSIERAKTIRYYNQRLVLMNIKYASRDISHLVEDALVNNTEPIYPVVRNIGSYGYNQPYNAAYNRSFTRGEKYGFAIVFFDDTGEKSFAVPLPNSANIKMPERREELAGKNKAQSDGALPTNNNTLGNNTNTYEAFNYDSTIEKTDNCSFINISCKGGKGSFIPHIGPCSNGGVDVNDPDLGDQWYCTNHGRFNCNQEPMTIYNPTGDNDNDVSEHNYNPTQYVYLQSGPNSANYAPKGFGGDIMALGASFDGIDPDKLPSWVQSFMIVRTKPAKRVVAQGIGHYALCSGTKTWVGIGNKDRCSKDKKALWFYSSDMSPDTGIVPQETIDDIKNNPNKYKLQLVSPLGFFSEWYNGKTDGNRDESIDMVTYPKINYENGEYNYGDNAWEIGLNGYVQFGNWRNQSVQPAWCPGGDIENTTLPGYQGDGIFDLAPNGLTEITTNSPHCEYPGDRSNSYFRIRTIADIYAKGFVGGFSDKHFNDSNLKEWHEPMYMCNIIQESAEVPQADINEYYETSAYIKLKSQLGTIDGANGQQFLLVDERWEDCIPTLDPADPIAPTYNSYVRVKIGTTTQYALNITYKTVADINNIKNTIDLQGSYWTGQHSVQYLYTHDSPGYNDGQIIAHRQHAITFDNAYSPQIDSEIWVYYEKSRPVKVYGGEGFIGDQTWCPIDMQVGNNGDHNGSEPTGTAFWMNNGFPYYRVDLNHRIIKANKAWGNNTTTNKIQDKNCFTLDWLRQMVQVFGTESRASTPSYFEIPPTEDPSLATYFPATHYIERPLKWHTGDLYEDNFCDENGLINNDYLVPYPKEYDLWQYGGFRFKPQHNFDYTHTQNSQVYFNKPPVGFEEQTEFCTRVIYSLERPINTQDVPGLRTFNANAFFDISDDTGEIKYAYDSLSGKGNNLYAFTDEGICLLLTTKSIITDKTVDEIALIGTESESFIQGQYWLSKVVGMDAEMWRTAAEGGNMIFFTNLKSSFSFIDNQIKNIGRLGYHSRIYQEYLKHMSGEYVDLVSGCYDMIHNEYWVNIISSPSVERGEIPITLAFNMATEHWNGGYGYNFRRYVSFDNITYGIQNQSINTTKVEAYTLNVGTQIAATPIEGWALQAYSPNQLFSKEFIRVRIASDTQPTKVEFFDSMDQFNNNLVQALLDPSISVYYLKNYGAWEQYVPRRQAAADPDRKRMQGRLLICKITHNDSSDFKLVDTGVQYKVLV